MKTAVTAAAIALMAVSMASGNVRAYAIDPVRADWSGKADPRPTHGVSEVITVCFDSLTDPAYIECFVGDGNPTGYHVDVKTYPGPIQVTVASGDGAAPHAQAWARFSSPTVQHPELIVKGRQLEFRFTRSGSDSIQFYWAEDPNSPTGDGPYHYGHMIGGGQATAA